MKSLMNALQIARVLLAIPIGLLAVALMALAVLVADGHAELRAWWRLQ